MTKIKMHVSQIGGLCKKSAAMPKSAVLCGRIVRIVLRPTLPNTHSPHVLDASIYQASCNNIYVWLYFNGEIGCCDALGCHIVQR